jgi:thymidylate synthase (FAD)
MNTYHPVLDHGYVKYVDFWGSEAGIISAARMSTDKGFQGWGPLPCDGCDPNEPPGTAWRTGPGGARFLEQCPKCKGTSEIPGDEKLLKYLWEHEHTTPFEMAGLTIEVQAPIFVFRQWHRHRTQSYNELSARYTPLPDVNYRPTRERIIDGVRRAASNRQAAGMVPLVGEAVDDWLHMLDAAYAGIEQTYQTGLAIGIPKEIARIVLPVGRYSRMRASANLWNWLRWLRLRQAHDAQGEIGAYANAVAGMIAELFPRTYALFDEARG